MNRLEANLGRIRLKNPITVASGTFGLDFANFYDLNRLGAIVSKTLTFKTKSGNPPPRLYETKAGLLNSIGLQNPGVKTFCKNDLMEYQEIFSPLFVSVSGSKIKEFIKTVKYLEKFNGIAGYEINVSCPNVKNEGIAFGTDEKIVAELIEKIRKTTKREIIVKLTPNVTSIERIAKAAEDNGADCLALINTLQGMAINWKTGKSFIKKGIAGYSGPAVKPVALQNVYRVHQTVEIPIIGMGGICNFQDAMEFFYAGATAVAVGTFCFVEPKLPMMILDELKKYLEKDDKDLKDIIGEISF